MSNDQSFPRPFDSDVLLQPQDQTVKAAEARELEAELARMREENTELRKRLSESSSLEATNKKADARIEQLEQKVRVFRTISGVLRPLDTDTIIAILKMEDIVQEKVTQKENELHATYDEKIRNYEERYV